MAKIIISLPEELLIKVDAYCRVNEYNRSEFIRYAMREVLLKIIKKEEE
jgi:metal-responsive CopG/Arc/MetJ family transcriptional regulator